MNTREVLRRYFGFHSFRAGQEQIVEQLLRGRDVLCVMPTGAGKSICYQIPALMLDGITFVISPLISLMKDQVGALVQNGVKAAYLNSSLSALQQNRVLDGIAGGIYRIVYVTPERLESDSFRRFCASLKLTLIAVDEAHCVSQWGQDFRPSYLQICEFVRALPNRPTMAAFTATATVRVKKDIEELLELRDPYCVTTGFDRPNLFFAVRTPADKDAELLSLLVKRREQHGIVYCSTRKNAESVCDFLCENGFSATLYHAGLSPEERRQNQDDFIFDRKTVMVATNAFGMGIDKSDVSYVIHYQVPKNIENYYQEAGRAGRDGSSAECILLYSKRDIAIQRYLINSSESNEALDAEAQEILRKRDLERLKRMEEYCTAGTCLRQFILHYFDEKAPHRCGYCGNCRRDFELLNITLPSQMLLSCVVRTGERLPFAVVTDILQGTESETVRQNRLHMQTTFGLLKESSRKTVEAILRFLIAEGYLQATGENEILKLTERSFEILRQRKPLSMPYHTELGKPFSDGQETVQNDALFKALKQTRQRLASYRHIPSYLVFSDATLADMCRKRPQTVEELLSVNGVGEVKTEQYGAAFLRTIEEYADATSSEPQQMPVIGRAWTREEDDRLTEAFYAEHTVLQMARSHSRSSREIMQRLKHLHLLS